MGSSKQERSAAKGRRNLHLLLWHSFFSGLIPAYVIERLFWAERGMSVQDVVYVEILYAVVILLLEIPSGILADKYGRRPLLVIAALCTCSEFIILIVADSFWHFALLVLIAAIGHSLSSGTVHALLYESLAMMGRTDEIEKQIGRLRSIDFTAAMMAALLGSFLASFYPLLLNYWLSLLSTLISLVLILLLKETIRINEDDGTGNGEKHYLRDALRFFIEQPQLCLALMTGMFASASLTYLDEFWQIYLDQLSVPILFFGAFSSLLMLSRVPGAFFAYRLTKRFSYGHILAGICAVSAFCYSLVAWQTNLLGMLAMVVICFTVSLLDPILSGYLQRQADEGMRATLDSVRSLGGSAFSMLLGLGFGYISQTYSIFAAFGLLAVFSWIFLLVFLWLRRSLALS